ncbi:hypothetical protein RJ639_019107 [Escallonia herrerae]|uniref:Retrotransposon Copia-like N-terminal domain-containing protein n=1 Tax=Escallonia herrerae TaxID=1293975 RepID=A0AA89AI45_9ASTE|nr:hypothetical protein RJ639_019107 [Escallonia herrerae]
MSSLIPQNDFSQLINIILDGPNYPHWAQAMRSSLKGRKLWLFASGDRTKPLQRKGGPASTPKSGSESDEDFANRLKDWDSINHRIIAWFSNTSIASINMQFGRFDTAKEAWDTLAQRYTSTDLANQLVFEDLLAQGGLVEVEKKNVKKAKLLYNAIDGTNGFYRCPAKKSVSRGR